MVDVVVAVRVAVCTEVSLIVTEVGERLHVGSLTGFETLVVTVQESETEPVNEFDGVTEMVDVLPVVAPAVTLIAPLLLREKLVVPVVVAGACQKSPHPVQKATRSGAATNNSQAHFPDFIPAPCFFNNRCSKPIVLAKKPFHNGVRRARLS